MTDIETRPEDVGQILIKVKRLFVDVSQKKGKGESEPDRKCLKLRKLKFKLLLRYMSKFWQVFQLITSPVFPSSSDIFIITVQ